MKRLTALLIALSIAGCANSPTPPPEPDMSNMVNVNRTVPDEIEPSRLPASENARGEEQ